jgi:hypothetical protein
LKRVLARLHRCRIGVRAAATSMTVASVTRRRGGGRTTVCAGRWRRRRTTICAGRRRRRRTLMIPVAARATVGRRTAGPVRTAAAVAARRWRRHARCELCAARRFVCVCCGCARFVRVGAFLGVGVERVSRALRSGQRRRRRIRAALRGLSGARTGGKSEECECGDREEEAHGFLPGQENCRADALCRISASRRRNRSRAPKKKSRGSSDAVDRSSEAHDRSRARNAL